MRGGLYLDIHGVCATELFVRAAPGDSLRPVAVLGPRFWAAGTKPECLRSVDEALRTWADPSFTLADHDEWPLRRASFKRVDATAAPAPARQGDDAPREYLVLFETSLDAPSALAAATTAYRWMLDPESLPPCLSVVDMATGERTELDLAEINLDEWP